MTSNIFKISKALISLIMIFFFQLCFQQSYAQSFKLGASNLTDEFVDQMVVAFYPGCDFGIDPYDATKLWNSEPSMPNFYSALGPNSEPYTINMLPVLDDTTIYITLGFAVTISDDYHITFIESSGLLAGTEITLIDSIQHIHTDMLGTSPDYTFYMANNSCYGSEPQCIGRFYLKIYYPSSTPGVKTKTIQPAPYCKGQNITINYTATGTFDPSNVFTAELSDASGSFSTATILGSVTSSSSGAINALIPTSIPTGTGYRIRVNSTNPQFTGVPNTTDLKIGTIPNVTYTGSIPQQCSNGSPINLFSYGSVSPTGGYFEGNGVTNNNFNPSIAGSNGSPYTISYIYNDFAGCADTAYNTVVVNPKPNVSFSGTLQAQCENSTSYDLTADAIVSPAGGYFSGIGVNGNIFNASLIPTSQNNATIYYVYNDANACIDSASNTIVINDIPTVSINNIDPMYCNYNSDIVFFGTPFGGTFTIDGVIGNVFSPSSLGLGTHTVIYTYTDVNSCSNSVTVYVDVDECINIDDINDNNYDKTFIYPNPSNDFINIITAKNTHYNISIYSITGQKIYETYISDNQNITNHQINVKEFNKGVYFIKIDSGNYSENFKIVIGL